MSRAGLISPLLATTVAVVLFGNCGRGSVKDGPKYTGQGISFQGTLLALSPNPGPVSGGIAAYQLAKYRVVRVCLGQLDSQEIVVDQLILTGDELDSLKVGDTVCVLAHRSNKILSRWNYPGIREESDPVETYYLCDSAKLASDPDCKCRDDRK